jgi:hypothetical protein
LSDDQRDALARELDGVRVAELVRREAHLSTRPVAASRQTVEHAEQRPMGSCTRISSHGCSSSHPQRSIPTSRPRPPFLSTRAGPCGADPDRPRPARRGPGAPVRLWRAHGDRNRGSGRLGAPA